ncbi:MAG TPA: peptide chain release factor N(5)-glutamine methyltransferase [Methylomirabilota bacterium]|nr:peptide chain release factor N(5)-glutamine methyltransferase [Methylomirabilota bacterium]
MSGLGVNELAVDLFSLLQEGRRRLESAGLPTARHDAETLLADLLGMPRWTLYLHRDRPMDHESVERYRALVERRARHEPLQYLRQEEEFFGLKLLVTPGVFIPRPETELLVERLLALLPPRTHDAKWGADLGTGTGCIALALCQARPDLRIVAVDQSPDAVALARDNATELGLADRVEVREGDLWEPIRDLKGRLDFVVSNPPYIAREQLEELPVEVIDYEPTSALDGGPGGTAFYDRIIREAPIYLKPGGLLAMEIGLGQAESLTRAMGAAGFVEISSLPDLRGIDRVLTGRRP